MIRTESRKPADPRRHERFLVWVCSSLACPEFGPWGDRPRHCFCGRETRPTPLTLIAEKDA